jgi:hypothetical protein
MQQSTVSRDYLQKKGLELSKYFEDDVSQVPHIERKEVQKWEGGRTE